MIIMSLLLLMDYYLLDGIGLLHAIRLSMFFMCFVAGFIEYIAACSGRNDGFRRGCYVVVSGIQN